MPRESPPQVAVFPGQGGIISNLNENDVLSGRGNRILSHPGSITFRSVLVENYKDEYSDPMTRKAEKAHVAARLVAEIRRANPPGRFLKECIKDGGERGQYVEIGDQKAWQKAAQALRDANNNRDTQPLLRNNGCSSNNNLPSGSCHRRLVIVRPSSVNNDDNESERLNEQDGQWPFYRQHCRAYGFAVQVDQLLATSFCSEGQNPTDNAGNGPCTNLLLVNNDENRNSNSKMKRAPLQCISERLVIRHVPCDKSSNTALHPDLKDGDIIQTLDGKPDPTFAMLYAMMCRREKLVLEVVGENSGAIIEVGRRSGVDTEVMNDDDDDGASNSNTNNTAKNPSGSESESVILPSKRPSSSRSGANSRVTPSEMMELILPNSSEQSKSSSSEQDQSSSSSKIASNPYNQPARASEHQYRLKEANGQHMEESCPSKNAHKRPWRETERNEYDDEVALFDMVEEQLKEQKLNQPDERRDDQNMHAMPTNAGSHSKSLKSNVGTASRINSTKVKATTDTAVDNSQCSVGKAVNTSSSTSPTSFDCTGNCDDSISLSSSSSSTSDSDSSSSSDSDSSSSSDSDSSSDSSSSNDSNTDKNCNKKPQSLPRKNSSQSLQKNAVQATLCTLPNAGPLIGGIGGTHKSISSKPILQLLTHESRPSKPTPLQASRKRPPPTQNTPIASSSSNNANEAPTSLSRLWPDPSDVIKALTRWQPPIAAVRRNSGGKQTVEFHGPIQSHCSGLENERNNPLLQHTPAGISRDTPKEFKNASAVMEAMAHPLINEGLCSINGDYHADKYGNGRWNRDSYNLRLTKLTEVSPIFRSESYFCDNIKMYEAQFSAHGETNLPPSNLSELYCMYFPGWQDCKFGIVAHDFPTTITFRKYNEGKAFLKLWLVVHPNERDTKQTGWLSQNDFKKLLDPHKNGLLVRDNAIFTLISVGSTTNVVRQFEAIKCLPYLKPHLQKALFTSYITGYSKPAATTKPRSLPMDIWRSLINSHNSYQLSSISRVLTGSCRENLNLVQGPPGTGKSSTIVGLVSALLSGKAPLPKQRQSGCLIHPGKTMGATFIEPQARNRILVCAATNQAVDSLAWKIKQGSIGPSGKVGEFAMARFGSLPWELGRDSTAQKPEMLSEMEDFLYEINVDRRASDGMQDFEYDHHPQEEVMCWSPEKRKPKPKKRRKIVGRAKLRSQILGSSSVVVATLSGAGSKAFIDAVCRDPTRNDSEFDAVIIDEACQASEPESLIPFKYNPTTITLVGDPKQLPVLTLFSSSSNSTSLFERLQSLNFPTILLRNQYRMHEDIASFPSQQFYEGKLITPDSVKIRSKPSWSCPCFPTICFWDINGQNMAANPMGYGFTNKEEADFITHTILSTLAHTFSKQSEVDVTVGIISFYRDQVKLLKEQLSRIPALNNSRLKVKVATVDGFQGSECDIIILSCVRSHSRSMRDGQRTGSIGFLNDYRRVNVAITRAKRSLWIVGNAEVLQASELWRKLIQHMDHQRVLRRGEEFRDLFARWKASKE